VPIYNKLVRDLIPEIIANKGSLATTKILDDSEYIKELQKKAYEELQEYIEAKNKHDSLEELADLFEVIHALAAYHGSCIKEVDEIRKQKFNNRGGFNNKVFLIEVKDKDKLLGLGKELR
jgi:predicted house-cleaning noncanonical NTP pyrophosphatase (MazG superfamily)